MALRTGPHRVRIAIFVIRSVVLASATLVVLSACASGQPDVVAAIPSPTASGSQPATAASDDVTMSIADVMRSDERFSRYRDILERTETQIAESILAVFDFPAARMGNNRDGVTVFAPTDAAFEALDQAVLAVIEDPQVDNDLLYSLFGHHYVHRLYPSHEFEPGDQVTWRRSASGPVQLGTDPFSWGGHPIVQTDIRAANGYIHAVDGVVVPDDLAAAAGT